MDRAKLKGFYLFHTNGTVSPLDMHGGWKRLVEKYGSETGQKHYDALVTGKAETCSLDDGVLQLRGEAVAQ